jgi:uracil-DNA glycosylase
MNTVLLENIKNALEFYEALGFERLPMRLKKPADRLKPGSKRLSVVKHNSPAVTGDRPMVDNVRNEKELALKLLQDEIGDCMRCKLSGKRKNIVFGEGNPDARLMFIGEAPGAEEDLQGRPFVGDAGMVLTRLINKMGYQREEVYIANIVKCRPPLNRDPEPDEAETCKGFVERQIDIIRPEVIISLGRVATMNLTGDMKLKITAVRGKFFSYKGISVMPTFHPAYLIRNPKDKWLTWNDAQKALEKLGTAD